MTKFRSKKSICTQQQNEFFEEHLQYEINMLRALIYELPGTSPSTVIRNVVIEGIAVHARNLIEFFKNKAPCDFDPRRFTATGYNPNGNFIDAVLESKINQQVSHLTAERTRDASKKIGTKELQGISEAIEREIDRFGKALTSIYQENGKLRYLPPLFVSM
jgi:hypothetical protein